jgi:hypothetical protein
MFVLRRIANQDLSSTPKKGFYPEGYRGRETSLAIR